MILASSFLIDKKSSWDENKTLKEITFIQTDKEKKKKKNMNLMKLNLAPSKDTTIRWY